MPEAAAPTVVLDSGIRIAVPASGEAFEGDPVTVMLRPERLTAINGEAPDGRSVNGSIRDVIFQGSEIRLLVDLPDGTEVVAKVESDDDLPPLEPGTPITLGWAPDAPYMLRGRSIVVGATSTDVDEVQAALDGTDIVGTAATADTAAPSERRFGRRTLIGGGIVAAGAVGAVVLSSIGGNDGGGGGGTAAAAGGAGGGIGQGASDLSILNWTEYIDVTGDGEVGTVDRFSDETGISVNYSETLNDNNEAYAKEFVAYLEAGNPTPWDIADADLLDGSPPEVQGMVGAAALQPHPELRQPRAVLPRRGLGPRCQVQPPLAGRYHRLRLQHLRDRSGN